jgi:hypothetical protein
MAPPSLYPLQVSDRKHDVRIGLLHKENSVELTYGCGETKFSVEALTAFADAWLAGQLSPAKRTDVSAPPAGMEDEGGAAVDESAVVVLTGDSFDAVVRDPTKVRSVPRGGHGPGEGGWGGYTHQRKVGRAGTRTSCPK